MNSNPEVFAFCLPVLAWNDTNWATRILTRVSLVRDTNQGVGCSLPLGESSQHQKEGMNWDLRNHPLECPPEARSRKGIDLSDPDGV
jgi:hypothetical protein